MENKDRIIRVLVFVVTLLILKLLTDNCRMVRHEKKKLPNHSQVIVIPNTSGESDTILIDNLGQVLPRK